MPWPVCYKPGWAGDIDLSEYRTMWWPPRILPILVGSTSLWPRNDSTGHWSCATSDNGPVKEFLFPCTAGTTRNKITTGVLLQIVGPKHQWDFRILPHIGTRGNLLNDTADKFLPAREKKQKKKKEHMAIGRQQANESWSLVFYYPDGKLISSKTKWLTLLFLNVYRCQFV